MKRLDKKQNLVIIILFLMAIYAITIATLCKSDREFSDQENRPLAEAPKLTVSGYFSGTFSKDYETYLADQFIWRDTWISLKTKIERAIQKQEINDIYFAKDGYFIEKHTASFSGKTKENNITYLAEFMEKCQQRYGAAHCKAIIVPNAVDILRDKLPLYASPYDESSYLAQIAEALPEGAWVDSESILNEHKEEALFYRTDHHWKTLAAYYVYEDWAKSIGLPSRSLNDYQVDTVTEDFLGTIASKVGVATQPDSIQIVTPKEEVPYTVRNNRQAETKDTLYHMEALDTKDKYALFFGGNQPIIEVTVNNQSDRKLLVIQDSYAHCFIPFTLQDFSTVDFIDLRYFNESLSAQMTSKQYTDVLFLYNVAGFAGDPNVARLQN